MTFFSLGMQSYSPTVHSKFTASGLGCGAGKDAFLFVCKRKIIGILRDRIAHVWRKTQNDRSCLICHSSCCRSSCVSIQPCTPKVLPNTETFLPSRVFCVACVVPKLCQLMYSLSVCSDGTTSAAPPLFRQIRPPSRTSFTYCMWNKRCAICCSRSRSFFFLLFSHVCLWRKWQEN